MKISSFAHTALKKSPYYDDQKFIYGLMESKSQDLLLVESIVPISKILKTSFNEDSVKDLCLENVDDPVLALVDGYYHILSGHGMVESQLAEGHDTIFSYIVDLDT
jgi:hypothetical protein